MQYTYKENIIDISLPAGKEKNILYAISGGADSAILLYILAKLNKESGNNHKIIPFTVPRPDGGADYSPAIVKWISEKLSVDIPSPIVVGDGDLPHNVVVKVVIKELMSSGKYDYLYVAENKIPADFIEGLAPVRAPHSKFKRASLPFWAVTKDAVLNLYYEEDIPELLELSHSCTELKVGRCSKCFQCNERAWAFTQLGKNDPGIR